MKKIALLLFTTFLSISSFGQNCKYKTNEVDEFTKNKILETKEELLTVSGMGFGFSTSYNLKKVNENRYLKLNISSPKILTIKAGDEIMFKTNNDNPISLKFSETVILQPQYNSSSRSTIWYEFILIPISDENYTRLLQEPISKLRLYTSDGFIDDEIKDKRDKKLKELLKCIE
jgi:hypothetical protein